MKMQPDRLDGVNIISRLDPGRLWVHQTPFGHSVLVPHRGQVQPWPVAQFEHLCEAHFSAIAALRPEVVILGTGARHRFVPPAISKPLIAAGIGFETMDTPAACRTYNVLASEGRAVLAALLLSPP